MSASTSRRPPTPADPAEPEPSRRSAAHVAATVFAKVGVLPVMMLAALIVFSLLSDNFLTIDNLLSALRQNSYIVIVVLAQFLVLLSGGFDLSVGSVTALVSVTSATAMAGQTAGGAAPGTAMAIGIAVGLGVGLVCGLINAGGIAFLNVNPFIMTLATASVFQGVALRMTQGVPVYGMPREFSGLFGYRLIAGIGVSVWIALAAAITLWALLTYTRPGRHIFAVGSNPEAAELSGVNRRRTLIITYATAGVLVAVGSVLLTARLETGEANIGSSLPLQTIAAAVIGGVSLRGGIGRVYNAVLGALFVGLVINGMNLARIESNYQTIVVGVVLAAAVVADQFRQRVSASVLARKV
jgi:ribose transport system permease protein